MEMDQDRDMKVSFKEFKSVMDKRSLAADVMGDSHTDVVDRLCRSFFHSFDITSSGDLTFEELIRRMFRLATERDVHKMIELAFPPPDIDSAKVKATPHELTDAEMDELRQLFNMYDTDSNGHITLEEFRTATISVPGVNRDDCRKMLEDMDKNGDKLVSLQEFVAGMKSMFDPRP